MERSPLVSIILPTYNRSQLLLKSINSVLSQTYPNWELIIWDDGSIDDTGRIIKSFKDKRIKPYHEDNHGMSSALNNAIKKAQGEYIAFLDDDDIWTEHKLSSQMDILITNANIDLVFGNFINTNLIKGEAGIGFEQSFDAMKELKIGKVTNDIFVITGNFPKSVCISNFLAFDTVIVRRNIFNKVGWFIEELRNGMDFEFYWRLALFGGVFAYTNGIVLNRIKYPESLSSPCFLTFESTLKALDICMQETLSKGKNELIPYLNTPYRNAWQNLIPVYGDNGDAKGMLKAFTMTLRYGFRLGSIRIFLETIIKLILRKVTNI